MNVPLIETPQSITVIPRDQIDLLDWQNLSQVVRYTSGIIGENYGPDPRYDWLTLRGFYPPQYIDGLQGPNRIGPERRPGPVRRFQKSRSAQGTFVDLVRSFTSWRHHQPHEPPAGSAAQRRRPVSGRKLQRRAGGWRCHRAAQRRRQRARARNRAVLRQGHAGRWRRHESHLHRAVADLDIHAEHERDDVPEPFSQHDDVYGDGGGFLAVLLA